MKRIEIVLVAIIIALSATLVASHIFQSHEQTCFKLYKEWSDFEDWNALQLGEREAVTERAKILVKYVEMNCPEFRDMDFIYNLAKQWLESFP